MTDYSDSFKQLRSLEGDEELEVPGADISSDVRMHARDLYSSDGRDSLEVKRLGST